MVKNTISKLGGISIIGMIVIIRMSDLKRSLVGYCGRKVQIKLDIKHLADI